MADIEQLLNEIKHTYADNQNDGRTFEETEDIRRLDWRANEAVTGEDIATALKATGGGYNEFDPESAAAIILRVDPQARVFVAREGSVCLYIKTTWPADMIRALDADEGDVQPDGLLRVWWG